MAGLVETCSHIGAILHWMETAALIRNDTPWTSLEDKWLMPAPVQDTVSSFTCIPGHSRKIEAPSLSEIEFSHPYDWGKKQNEYLELKTRGAAAPT